MNTDFNKAFAPLIISFLIIIIFLIIMVPDIAERERQDNYDRWEQQRFIYVDKLDRYSDLYVDKETKIEYIVTYTDVTIRQGFGTSTYRDRKVSVRYDENGKPKVYSYPLENPYKPRVKKDKPKADTRYNK